MIEYRVIYWDDSLSTKELVAIFSSREEALDFIERQDAAEMYYIEVYPNRG